jgi:excisionase family DNA binding protein
MSPVPGHNLLTVRAAAEKLAVSPSMVRALLRRGELPGVRVGRLVRIAPERLDRFLAANTIVPAAKPPVVAGAARHWRKLWADGAKPP